MSNKAKGSPKKALKKLSRGSSASANQTESNHEISNKTDEQNYIRFSCHFTIPL